MYIVLTIIAVQFLLLLLALLFHRSIFKWLDGYFYRRLDVEQYNLDNPYANGHFRPVNEELHRVEAKITGEIPADLEGDYLRNGPNQRFKSTGRMHMFDGEGMIHQVQLKDGKAYYSNTYIRTPRFLTNEQRGMDCYTHVGDLAGGGMIGLAKMVCEQLKKKLGVLPKRSRLESGSNSTALLFHNQKLYALQEVAYPFELNLQLGSTTGLQLDGNGQYESFQDKLTAPFSAHVKTDPTTGELIFFTVSFETGQIYYAEVSKEGDLKTFESVAQGKPAMGFLHDCFLTNNYAICPDLSIRFDIKQAKEEHQSPWYFDTNSTLKFGVLDRNSNEKKQIQWFDTGKAGFIWHTINAWEEKREDGGTDLVLFAPLFDEYPSTIPIHLPQEPKATVHLWRLNLDSGEITETRKLLEQFYERPTINDNYIGQRQRYTYLLDKNHGGILGSGIQKYDLIEEKKLEAFNYGEMYGGEPLFVSRKDAQNEDDGYIIETLMSEDTAQLLILDASDLSEKARIHLPQRVPFGVHALWVPNHELQSAGMFGN